MTLLISLIIHSTFIVVAKSLLIAGCNVFITGRNKLKLDAAAAELTEDDANHGEVQIFQGDVTDEESVCELFDLVIDTYGQIDLLINNAGISIPGSTDSMELKDFRRVMDVNVIGPFLCSREAIRRMKERGKGGRIVNIGSLSAQSPRPESCSYCTSKYALLGMTNSLSLDCRGHDIAVGIIHPGNVMSALLTEEEVRERGRTEGFMSAQDVSSCVLAMALLPYHANILEMTVIPTKQPFVGRG